MSEPKYIIRQDAGPRLREIREQLHALSEEVEHIEDTVYTWSSNLHTLRWRIESAAESADAVVAELDAAEETEVEA